MPPWRPWTDMLDASWEHALYCLQLINAAEDDINISSLSKPASNLHAADLLIGIGEVDHNHYQPDCTHLSYLRGSRSQVYKQNT